MNNETNQNNLFQTNSALTEPQINNNPVPQRQPSIESAQGNVVPMPIPTEIVGSQTPYMGGNAVNNTNSFATLEQQTGYVMPTPAKGVSTENAMGASTQNPMPFSMPDVNMPPSNQQVLQNDGQQNDGQQNVITPPTASFTEMPFAGVNQQEIHEEKVNILPNTQIATGVENKAPEVVSNSNMQPVEKKTDENAGLKFLLILFIIFLIVILCLPLVGLN